MTKIKKSSKGTNDVKLKRRAKTVKGRKHISLSEPQFVEGNKTCVYCRSLTCKAAVSSVLNDLFAISRPFAYNVMRMPNLMGKKGINKPTKESVETTEEKNSKKENKKNKNNQTIPLLLPFEDMSLIEKLCRKFDFSSLFVLGDSTKRHSSRITMGRLFDTHLLDMYQFHIIKHTSIAEFQQINKENARKLTLKLLQQQYQQSQSTSENQNNHDTTLPQNKNTKDINITKIPNQQIGVVPNTTISQDTALPQKNTFQTNPLPTNIKTPISPPRAGSKPLLLLQGAAFESSENLKHLKIFFSDFFKCVDTPTICLDGIDRAIVITALEGTSQDSTVPPSEFTISQNDLISKPADLTFPKCNDTTSTNQNSSSETFSTEAKEKTAPIPSPSRLEGTPLIIIKQFALNVTGSKVSPHVQMQEIGPHIEMFLIRSSPPSEETFKEAIKVPKSRQISTKDDSKEADKKRYLLKKKASKNTRTNVLGETIGRIHVGKPNYTKLHTPHHHGINKKNKQA